MGTLASADGDGPVRLRPRHRIGRTRGNELVVPHRSVSGAHALVLWRDGRWWVRDLGSRNGTWVGGEAVGVGEEVALAPGVPVRFGTESTWSLTDASPPSPWAVAGDRVVDGEGDLLALPDPDTAAVCVLRVEDGWAVEGGPEVADGGTLEVDGVSWTLHLPEPVDRTWCPGRTPPSLGALRLHFQVTHDEEHVHVQGHHDGGVVDLGARVPHYLLLLLARARLADADEPDPAARGWCYRDDLCRQLGIDEIALNSWVYRSRRLFARRGVVGATGLVERRVGTGQLRLGVADVTVTVAG